MVRQTETLPAGRELITRPTGNVSVGAWIGLLQLLRSGRLEQIALPGSDV